jgi:AcrR family transcriptional regulator
MSQPDTKQRILNAAEELFAVHSFHATSLRAITQQAGVNLASVNYHFGSKDALLDAVIERRLEPLNARRSELLDEVERMAEDSGQPPEIRAVWRAFVEPTLLLRKTDAGAEYFITLVGRALAEPHGTATSIFLKQMGPLMFRFFEMSCSALPSIPRQLLFWRMHFAIGSFSHLMRSNEQSPLLPEGVSSTVEMESLIEMLLDYTVAGLEAPQ